MSMWTPSWLAVLMMQFWTYFWRFRQCQLNFMPFASTLHAAVAFSRATLSALDIFAASAGVGMNAMPLTSTVAIMPANEAVAKWYMIRSFELIRSLELLAVEIGTARPNRRKTRAEFGPTRRPPSSTALALRTLIDQVARAAHCGALYAYA